MLDIVHNHGERFHCIALPFFFKAENVTSDVLKEVGVYDFNLDFRKRILQFVVF